MLLLIAYLLGSIPFGLIVARLKDIDIRQYGSGNIGATNVFRIMGPTAGITVFALDLFKGTLAVYLMSLTTSDSWLIILAGFLAILGHTYSIFLKFKGGRGAATGLGVLFGIAPDIFLAAVIVAVAVIATSRYVSLGSIITALFVTAAFFVFGRPLPYTIISAIVALLIIIKHRDNIKRLINQTEPKIGE